MLPMCVFVDSIQLLYFLLSFWRFSFRSRTLVYGTSSMCPFSALEVVTMRWASPGTTCPGLNALLLVLEVSQRCLLFLSPYKKIDTHLHCVFQSSSNLPAAWIAKEIHLTVSFLYPLYCYESRNSRGLDLMQHNVTVIYKAIKIVKNKTVRGLLHRSSPQLDSCHQCVSRAAPRSHDQVVTAAGYRSACWHQGTLLLLLHNVFFQTFFNVHVKIFPAVEPKCSSVSLLAEAPTEFIWETDLTTHYLVLFVTK